MRVSNHPKVVISQPIKSLPRDLRSVLLENKNNVSNKTRSSSNVYQSDRCLNKSETDDSLFQFSDRHKTDKSVVSKRKNKSNSDDFIFSATEIEPDADDSPYLQTYSQESSSSSMIILSHSQKPLLSSIKPMDGSGTMNKL